MRTILEWFVQTVLAPRWVVNDEGEMGVRILGVNLYYYKYTTPLLYPGHRHDDGKPMSWRYSYKREFNETVRSRYGFGGA